jgi:cbb3-type cytochrome oxidase subunit 1
MRHLDRAFIIIAICYAIVGQALGIYMGIGQQFQHAHLHAHINLVGWASLALAGLIYRSYPRLAERAIARWHFWIANLGALLLTIGLFILDSTGVQQPVILGSLLTLAGTVLLLVNALRGME